MQVPDQVLKQGTKIADALLQHEFQGETKEAADMLVEILTGEDPFMLPMMKLFREACEGRGQYSYVSDASSPAVVYKSTPDDKTFDRSWDFVRYVMEEKEGQGEYHHAELSYEKGAISASLVGELVRVDREEKVTIGDVSYQISSVVMRPFDVHVSDYPQEILDALERKTPWQLVSDMMHLVLDQMDNIDAYVLWDIEAGEIVQYSASLRKLQSIEAL